MLTWLESPQDHTEKLVLIKSGGFNECHELYEELVQLAEKNGLQVFEIEESEIR